MIRTDFISACPDPLKVHSGTRGFYAYLASAAITVLFLFSVTGYAVAAPVNVPASDSNVSAPPCTTVSFPVGQPAAPASTFTVPVTTTDVTGQGILSFDTRITYDPAVLTYISNSGAGTLGSGLTFTVNSATPGTLIISAYGTAPLAGAGPIINLRFSAVGPIGSSSPLAFDTFTYNEGVPCTSSADGSINIVGCSAVSMPTALIEVKDSSFTVPVTTSDLTGLNVISFDIQVTYDSAVVSSTGVSTSGTLSSGLTVTVNEPTPGTLLISGYGTTPLAGGGTLFNIGFNATGPIGSSTLLNFPAFTYNEGTPCSVATNGDVSITAGSISGAVSYANSVVFKPVPYTTLNAVGSVNSSATSALFTGVYDINGLGSGPYTVTPTKPAEVPSFVPGSPITGFDSALIAQHLVLLTTLNAVQLLAADVSTNGIVTSFDAALIAQWIVGIPNAGITGVWKFLPPNRNYPEVAPDQVNQDYSALLMGEVSGNWTPPTSFAAVSPAATKAPLVTITTTAPNIVVGTGVNFTIPVTVSDTTGAGILSWQFDLLYDPAVITPQVVPVDTTGTLGSGRSVTYNVPSPGLLKVVIFGTLPLTGSGTLFNFKFTAVGSNNTSSPLTWQNFLYNEGDPVAATVNGLVQLIVNAAGASVSGRVTDQNGAPLRNVSISIADNNGMERSARTNPFGYYRFEDIPAGSTYVISARSKQHTFQPRVITVDSDVAGADLVADQ